eukprot:COSAG04_NODE_3967_length_2390_cov_6.717154_2_plen_238_part_00
MEQYQRLSSMDQMEQMKELAKEFTDVVPVPLTVRYPPPPPPPAPFRQAGRVDTCLSLSKTEPRRCRATTGLGCTADSTCARMHRMNGPAPNATCARATAASATILAAAGGRSAPEGMCCSRIRTYFLSCLFDVAQLLLLEALELGGVLHLLIDAGLLTVQLLLLALVLPLEPLALQTHAAHVRAARGSASRGDGRAAARGAPQSAPCARRASAAGWPASPSSLPSAASSAPSSSASS